MPPEISDQELADLKAKADKADDLAKEVEVLKAKPNEEPKPKDDKSLKDKVSDDTKSKEERAAEQKQLESALQFVMGKDTFLSENKDILPKSAADIFAKADKETYETKVEKAADIKAALIQTFFEIEDNVKLLTVAQRSTVEDYLKLTQNARKAKAADVFENVLEPAIAMVRQVKKAEEVNRARNGYVEQSDAQKAYHDKLVKGSRAHYLGESKNA